MRVILIIIMIVFIFFVQIYSINSPASFEQKETRCVRRIEAGYLRHYNNYYYCYHYNDINYILVNLNSFVNLLRKITALL
jgi:hypothetical protein